MKRFISITLFISLSLSLSIANMECAGAQPKSSKKNELPAQIKSKIENRNYIVRINTAMPSGAAPIHLTSDYSVRIAGDSVISYLPYYGRAYNIPYGGGEGLIFKSTTKDYTLGYGKKKNAEIRFSARTNEDEYQFSISIFSSGSAYITINPTNKQSISFNGQMDE